MLELKEEELDMLVDLVPDFEASPKEGRPPVDKRKALAGIFWVLDNGAKWKDLPKDYGSKSSVHRWFLRWVKAGVFEDLVRSMGSLVEEEGKYRLYECSSSMEPSPKPRAEATESALPKLARELKS